jgi:O-antigen/teichoic acid export membrane protein
LNLTFQNIHTSIKSNPILYRLAHGTFWSLLGTVMLGVADFGAYGMVQSTLEMFGLFAGFSLGATSSKYLAAYKTKDKEKASRILSLTNTFTIISSGIIGLVIYLSSSWIADETLKRIDLAPLLSLGALYLFISTQNNVQIGSLGGFEAFKETAKINSLQGILTPVVAIPLVYFFSLRGAIISLIVTSLVGYVLCRIVLNKKCKEFNIDIKRFDRSSFKEWPIIWHFSIPLLASGLLVMPVIWITNAILVNQVNGYKELGLFNAANQWRVFIIFIPQILSTVMLPMFSAAYSNKRDSEYNKIFEINLKLTWMIALPATSIAILIKEPLGAIFGRQYINVKYLVVILMVTAFLNIVNSVVGTALIGSGRAWIGAAFNLVWAAIMITSTSILAPHYGAQGLAVAYLISYALHTVFQMSYVDLYLVPKSIRKKKMLIIITIVTLLPVTAAAIANSLSGWLSILSLIIAIVPIIKMYPEMAKW